MNGYVHVMSIHHGTVFHRVYTPTLAWRNILEESKDSNPKFHDTVD